MYLCLFYKSEAEPIGECWHILNSTKCTDAEWKKQLKIPRAEITAESFIRTIPLIKVIPYKAEAKEIGPMIQRCKSEPNLTADRVAWQLWKFIPWLLNTTGIPQSEHTTDVPFPQK